MPRGVLLAGIAVVLMAATLAYASVARFEPNAAACRRCAAVTPLKTDLNLTRVFNDYDFGGYLIANGVAPFIDGRTDLYGEKFFIDHTTRPTGAGKSVPAATNTRSSDADSGRQSAASQAARSRRRLAEGLFRRHRHAAPVCACGQPNRGSKFGIRENLIHRGVRRGDLPSICHDFAFHKDSKRENPDSTTVPSFSERFHPPINQSIKVTIKKGVRHGRNGPPFIALGKIPAPNAAGRSGCRNGSRANPAAPSISGAAWPATIVSSRSLFRRFAGATTKRSRRERKRRRL